MKRIILLQQRVRYGMRGTPETTENVAFVTSEAEAEKFVRGFKDARSPGPGIVLIDRPSQAVAHWKGE